jgi:signal transduction histidine kinase
MIKKLRRKFVFINMLIVTMILVALFSTVMYMTHRGLVRDSEMLLHRVVDQGDAYRPSLPGGSGDSGDSDISTPYFTLSVDKSGRAVVAESKYFVLDDESAVESLIMQTITAADDEGSISGYNLRYYRVTTDSGWKIAFVDTSSEARTMKRMAMNSLGIGGACFVVFFIISVLLARWAVRPVQKSWEQQQQFVADASHELKTPLTIILSNADMLMSHEDADAEHEKRWTDNIKVAAERMKTLVEEMLCLAQSDSGALAPVMETVDFGDAATESILLAEPTFFENGRSLSDDVDEELYVRGDAAKLKQLVSILLDNACKYSPDGGEVKISLHGDGKRVTMKVNNQGEPLTPEQLGHIFERFYRADTARQNNGSFGLGLAIAQSIALQHGGKIWAESAADEGTTFVVQLPQCEK